MANFTIVQCENPACHLRMPIDLDQFSGKYCPSCGGSMSIAADLQSDQVLHQNLERARRPLVVILDNLRSAYNVGAIFRTADGVDVKKLYLCGITPTPNTTAAVTKTALGAENHVPWECRLNGLTTAVDLKEKGFVLVALERTDASLSINHYRPDPADQRGIALVLGNEKVGVDPGIMNLCEKRLSLPMMGKKASLNVAVAFGAAAYWLSFI